MQGATVEDPGSLPDLLQRFEDYSGLVLHWRFFGFGGHVLRPPGGVLASYTACNPRVSALVKSIVQPGWVRTLQVSGACVELCVGWVGARGQGGCARAGVLPGRVGHPGLSGPLSMCSGAC